MQTQSTFQVHEPAVANATLWFLMPNPMLWMIIYAMAEWLMN